MFPIKEIDEWIQDMKDLEYLLKNDMNILNINLHIVYN